MKLPSEAELLRIFVGETDKHHGRPLYEVIMEKTRGRGLAGPTVLRGTLGFGAHSRIHTSKILRLSEDLPMVVEIVDATDKIEGFLPDLDGLIDEGLVTQERVKVILYRHNEERTQSVSAEREMRETPSQSFLFCFFALGLNRRA